MGHSVGWAVPTHTNRNGLNHSAQMIHVHVFAWKELYIVNLTWLLALEESRNAIFLAVKMYTFLVYKENSEVSEVFK